MATCRGNCPADVRRRRRLRLRAQAPHLAGAVSHHGDNTRRAQARGDDEQEAQQEHDHDRRAGQPGDRGPAEVRAPKEHTQLRAAPVGAQGQRRRRVRLAARRHRNGVVADRHRSDQGPGPNRRPQLGCGLLPPAEARRGEEAPRRPAERVDSGQEAAQRAAARRRPAHQADADRLPRHPSLRRPERKPPRHHHQRAAAGAGAGIGEGAEPRVPAYPAALLDHHARREGSRLPLQSGHPHRVRNGHDPDPGRTCHQDPGHHAAGPRRTVRRHRVRARRGAARRPRRPHHSGPGRSGAHLLGAGVVDHPRRRGGIRRYRGARIR